MRIRSIKPEFWRSESISSLEIADRFLFIGLWSYVDDNGVGRDDDAFICADLFAHDLSVSPHDTLMRVHGGLKRLFQAGLIHRYEIDKRRYLRIVSWERHQRINRPSPGRFPLPDQGFSVNSDSTHDILSESSVSPQDTLSAGTEEQGNRGTGEQGRESAREKKLAAGPPAELSLQKQNQNQNHPPPVYCPDHPTGTTQKCQACGAARLNYQRWEKISKCLPPEPPRPPSRHEHKFVNGACLLCCGDNEHRFNGSGECVGCGFSWRQLGLGGRPEPHRKVPRVGLGGESS